MTAATRCQPEELPEREPDRLDVLEQFVGRLDARVADVGFRAARLERHLTELDHTVRLVLFVLGVQALAELLTSPKGTRS